MVLAAFVTNNTVDLKMADKNRLFKIRRNILGSCNVAFIVGCLIGRNKFLLPSGKQIRKLLYFISYLEKLGDSIAKFNCFFALFQVYFHEKDAA